MVLHDAALTICIRVSCSTSQKTSEAQSQAYQLGGIIISIVPAMRVKHACICHGSRGWQRN